MQEDNNSHDQLKLKNQLCFPLYAASRLMTRLYQPHLEELELTYPQYLVLMVLWEESPLTVKKLGNKIMLNTNTLTPLLKRMEKQEIIVRERSKEDERTVLISLTKKGINLKYKAENIPFELITDMDYPLESIYELKDSLDKFINHITQQNK